MKTNLLKGALVLVDRTDELNKKVDDFRGVMSVYGETVKKFHGKPMVTASDERDGLCFLKKFTLRGWVDVYREENAAGSGPVPFPAIALKQINIELFCADNLEDIVLIKNTIWFEQRFGNGRSDDLPEYKNLDQLFKFHGKTLRADWAETGKQEKGVRVLKKFALTKWAYIYNEEDNPDSGYLLFPEEIQDVFCKYTFFSEITH